MTFDPAAFGPAVAAVLEDGQRLLPLGPGTPNTSARPAIAALTLPPAALAGLFLYHDLFDESHAVSQDLNTPLGSLWHGILHRREPDAWNSKYWFRQAGHHKLFDVLAADCPALGYHYTSPAAFVDFCEKVRGTGTADERLAEWVQLLEWQVLFGLSAA